MSVVWLLMILMNMGVPPFRNLFAEIVCLVVMGNKFLGLMISGGGYIMARAAFSLLMYSSTVYGAFQWKGGTIKGLTGVEVLLAGRLVILGVL